MQAGKLSKAVQHFNTAIKLQPDEPSAHVAKGQVSGWDQAW